MGELFCKATRPGTGWNYADGSKCVLELHHRGPHIDPDGVEFWTSHDDLDEAHRARP